jgi:hypothetical protein
VVLGQRKAGCGEELVHRQLVERQPQRDSIVERNPMAPHSRAGAVCAELEEFTRQDGQLGADGVGRVLPDHTVGRLARVGGKGRETLLLAAALERVSHARRAQHVEAHSQLPAGPARRVERADQSSENPHPAPP